MGHNDHIDYDLLEAINDLIDEGYLEEGTSAFGIAQFLIHNSYEDLSEKQKYVYEKEIIPALRKRGEEIRVNEIKNSNPD